MGCNFNRVICWLLSVIAAICTLQAQTSLKPDLKGNSDGIHNQAFSDKLDLFLKSKRYSRLFCGLHIGNSKTGETLFSKNPDALFIPASALKIFISGIALVKLGSEQTITTPVYTDGDLNEGILEGNLYLKGMGDPALTHSQLQSVAREMKEMGIKIVDGNIIYDVSLFDEEGSRYPPNARHLYSPPSALTIDTNCINLKIIDGPPPVLYPIPECPYVKLDYQIQISRSNSANIPKMTYVQKPWGDLYTIRGQVNNWNKRYKTMRLCISRPGLYAATLLKKYAATQDIKIKGRIIKGIVPSAKKKLISIKGRPLIDSIRFLNSESNNVVAETVNKLLGARFVSQPGTRQKGLNLIRKYCMKELMYKSSNFRIRDTSGLSPANRLTPRQFTTALDHFYAKLDSVMFDVLPRQGYHAHARYPLPPAGMHVYVKSGTLPNTGVNSLVGYMMIPKTRQVFSFAILINRKGPGKPIYSGTYTNPILAKIMDLFQDNL